MESRMPAQRFYATSHHWSSMHYENTPPICSTLVVGLAPRAAAARRRLCRMGAECKPSDAGCAGSAQYRCEGARGAEPLADLYSGVSDAHDRADLLSRRQ